MVLDLESQKRVGLARLECRPFARFKTGNPLTVNLRNPCFSFISIPATRRTEGLSIEEYPTLEGIKPAAGMILPVGDVKDLED